MIQGAFLDEGVLEDLGCRWKGSSRYNRYLGLGSFTASKPPWVMGPKYANLVCCVYVRNHHSDGPFGEESCNGTGQLKYVPSFEDCSCFALSDRLGCC